MPTTDWVTADSVTNVDRSGAPAWSDESYAAVSDDNRAVVGMSAGAYSDWLRFAFDFSGEGIPEGATIVGVEARREGGATATNSVSDSAVYLRDSGGQVGDNKATATMWPSYSDGVEVHGAADDDWNAGLTYDDLADIGLDVSVINNHGTQARSAMLDCWDMRLTYEEAGGGALPGAMDSYRRRRV